MNKIIYITFIWILLLSCSKGENIESTFYNCNFNYADSTSTNANNAKYQSLINNITSEGVVGMMLSVYHPETGMWNGVSGKADLHNNVNMQPCNITRVGSTVKMFTAVTVLKLRDEGKLNLDDKISSYLQGDIISKIENADKATIRQLLQHSSGIYNYIENIQFQTSSTNNLIREWNAEDLLKYAYNKNANFEPDTNVSYSNTNYILLGLLIEKIEKKPFYKVFQDKIFIPLGLTMTKFAAEDHIPHGIVRGYIDLYSNLQVIESTYFSGWDYYTADGGLISNPYDMNIFFEKLMSGQVLSVSTLNEMLTWKTPQKQDTEFFNIHYGLGIFKMKTSQGDAYFHSGDAIGYYSNMIYFPDNGATIVYAVNSNYGKIDQFVSTKSAIENIVRITKP